MANIEKTEKLDNINKYIANAAILRDCLANINNIQDKFAKFTFLFPTIEDKMICKAIFDTLYLSDVKARKFISRMIDGLNNLYPQNLTEMVDVYNQTAVIVSEKIKKQEKQADEDGERSSQEEKQGTSEQEDEMGQKMNAFSVHNNVVTVQESSNFKKSDKKKQKQISVVSSKEIENIERLDKQKLAASKEDEKLKKYEESLKERLRTRKNVESLIDLQQVRSKYDD